jgi:hypothetical protein
MRALTPLMFQVAIFMPLRVVQNHNPGQQGPRSSRIQRGVRRSEARDDRVSLTIAHDTADLMAMTACR